LLRFGVFDTEEGRIGEIAGLGTQTNLSRGEIGSGVFFGEEGM
jgi:hypothetical protein